MSAPLITNSLPAPRPQRALSPAARAIVATAPAILTFAITVLLFITLTRFDSQALNLFTITVMAAVILSLLGTAGISPVTLGIIGDGSSGRDALDRVFRVGAAYSAGYAIAVSAALYHFLVGMVGLSAIDFGFFAALLFILSLVWVVAGAYAATRQHVSFAVVFVSGYSVQFLLTYALHRLDPSLTLLGYTAGALTLLASAVFTLREAFDRTEPAAGLQSSIISLLRRNPWASVFPILYAIAVFADKLIVWLWMGSRSGGGLVISSPYTFGAFLGLVPLFSLGTTIHFEARAAPLVKAMYQGRFSDIRRTANEYKKLYWRDLAMTLLFGLAFLAGAVGLARLLFPGDTGTVMKVLLTVGAGSIIFSTIIFNYMVLSLFGNMRIPTLSVLMVCVAEVGAIPLLRFSTWFAALGFLAGSLAAGLLSLLVTLRTLHSFEYHIFHYATMSSLKLAREERVKSPEVEEEEKQK